MRSLCTNRSSFSQTLHNTRMPIQYCQLPSYTQFYLILHLLTQNSINVKDSCKYMGTQNVGINTIITNCVFVEMSKVQM